MLVSQSGAASGSVNITGESWAAKSPGFAASNVNAVVCYDRPVASYPFSYGSYLAAGDAGKLYKTSDSIMSYDSESAWTQLVSSFGSTAIYGATAGAGAYAFLVGASGKIGRSVDGTGLTTWIQELSSFGLSAIFTVAGHEWLYVAAGAGGKLATKNAYPGWGTPGWTQRTSSFGTTFIYSVCVKGGSSTEDSRYVAVGNNGLLATWDTPGVWPMSDGATFANPWTQRLSSFGTTTIRSVAWSWKIKKFVAVGDSGKIAWSEDGALWYQVSNPPFGTSDILTVTSTGEYGDIFVAAGYDGKLAISTDGTNWTLTTSGFSGAQIIRAADGNSTTAFVGGSAGTVAITPVPQTIVTPVVPTPPPPIGATGGTTVDIPNYLSSGETWRVHTFVSSGSFTVTGDGSMNCMATGGGGGGHGGSAGIFGSGGHGGAVVSSTGSFVIGTYAVTVGLGGNGGLYQGAPSGTGGTSSIIGTGVSVVAAGGGGRTSSENGQDGIGASGSGRTGVSSTITGVAVGRGGGGGYALNVGNRGYVDGGGPGGDVSVNLGSPGITNSGGGGGGSYNSSNPGRDGGSGIVIIAYKIS